MLNVGVVGFYASGSSAVIDFLKEFDNVGIALDRDNFGKERPYEHLLFVSSGGLFDCVNLLTNGNSLYQSDMIINRFIRANERQFQNDFVSFGSYKKMFGPDFQKLYRRFLDDIGASVGGRTTEHKIGVRFSLIYAFVQIAFKILYGRPIVKLGKKNIYDGQDSYWACPSPEEVCSAAKRYTNGYFELCAQDKKDIMAYDQIVRPQNTDSIKKLFDSNFKVIVVMRDARDIYFLSKYFFSKPPYSLWSAPLPVDIDQFCRYWKANTTYDPIPGKVLSINFEDMIYKYNETERTICDFLGLDVSSHSRRFTSFDPRKSIFNTQTFYQSETTLEESKQIAEKIPECIYDFPYKHETNLGNIFDTPRKK